MTPLGRFYSRYLSPRLTWIAITLTYSVVLALLVLLGEPMGNDIIYIDVQEAK